MKTFDVHTHSTFSPDGKSPIEEMIKRAVDLGLSYYGTSEHYDLVDVYDEKRGYTTDMARYFSVGRELQEKYKDKIHLLCGAEFGYIDHPDAKDFYGEVIEKYQPDYVINSIHCRGLDGDYSFLMSYRNADGSLREKSDVYLEYLDCVYKSLSADYPYQMIGHLTYCQRYAPYENKEFLYVDFQGAIDKVLKEIIRLHKTLEINTKKIGFLPRTDVLKRYYELGGRKVSFGSDAHETTRILEKWDLVVDELKKIGFDRFTLPTKDGEIEFPF